MSGPSPLPVGCYRSRIIYLDMREPPWGVRPRPTLAPPPGLAVERIRGMSPSAYRALYRRIGERWLWWERLPLTDTELAALLADPRVEIRLLRQGERALGYAELDRRHRREVELVYFGLVPEAIGRGLGKFLLHEIVHAAWSGPPRPRRLWLHTCTEDHPRAIALYQAAGFRPYRCEEVIVPDPRLSGLLPSSARNLPNS